MIFQEYWYFRLQKNIAAIKLLKNNKVQQKIEILTFC